MDNGYRLRPSVLLGVSTSAVQADGGELGHSWNDWYAKGHIKDGFDPARAAGHWERWREDVLLMRKMDIQTCRLGIEWARIEPQEGVFDECAISRIKEEIMLMSALGIRPLIMLQSFSVPMWFEEKGGWLEQDNVRCFLIYVERVISRIGHLCSEFLTLNEPNVYAYNGYVFGLWPPGMKSMNAAFTVMSNMATAHIKAYRLIHDMRRSMGFHDTKVSSAVGMRAFAPKNAGNPLDRRSAATAEKLFQQLMAQAMLTGDFRSPLRNFGRDRRGAYGDFLAINYYRRSTMGAFGESAMPRSSKNDLGWEIYPRGLTDCCQRLRQIAPLPIYITENGVCDLGDAFRCRFIYEQLREISESKLPVKRYYYRGFTDGFEWLEGSFARFGLVHTDFDTLERTIKRSGEFYSQIIKEHAVTQEMYDEYVAEQNYHR